MQILTLSNCPLVESQGSGYVILNTARLLDEQGHKVKLVGPEEIMLFSFLKDRAKIYRIILGMGWWVLTNNIKKYDLFIFYGAESFFAVFLLKRIFGIKSPIILHSNGIEIMTEVNIKKQITVPQDVKQWYHLDLSRFFVYCYKRVDKVITVSKSESDFLVGILGIENKKVSYNNLALPEIYFKNSIIIERKTIITYCGSWISRKGVDVIVEAIEVVLKKYRNYQFRIIGVGKDFKVLDYFSPACVSQIEVIPFVEDKKDLMNLYGESSIFLFPSLSESFGLVVAEAMYCGCAVVSGPTGYAAEIINEQEGIILNKISKKSIIKALELLIGNEEFRKEIAFRGQQKVRGLTWENYSVRLKGILKSV